MRIDEVREAGACMVPPSYAELGRDVLPMTAQLGRDAVQESALSLVTNVCFRVSTFLLSATTAETQRIFVTGASQPENQGV